jgi:hypothetical protein
LGNIHPAACLVDRGCHPAAGIERHLSPGLEGQRGGVLGGETEEAAIVDAPGADLSSTATSG